jgi:hypothetical protein
LRSSRPQASTERGYTRRGHARAVLEDHFIHQLWKQSDDSKREKVRLKATYRPGFVVNRKGDSLYGVVKDSLEATCIHFSADADDSASEDSLW